MSGTRRYDFITGVETPSLPASAAAGGGGGGGLVWSAQDGQAPEKAQENGLDVYKFLSGDTQYLWTAIKVPSSYAAGQQLLLDIGIYSPSTSNTILLTATAYLIRQNTDAISSTTNAHTSTNSALTNASANRYRNESLDLSDTSGEINSVAIAANDIIRVRLSRGSDTDTQDIRFIASSTEVRIV